VLSAMFGVTNKLLDAAAAALKGDRQRIAGLRRDLLDLHAATAKGACCEGLGARAPGARCWRAWR
jgi:hypothetical protein